MPSRFRAVLTVLYVVLTVLYVGMTVLYLVMSVLYLVLTFLICAKQVRHQQGRVDRLLRVCRCPPPGNHTPPTLNPKHQTLNPEP